MTAADIKNYTGIKLCPAADVRDLTTTEERDTPPGFSFHVAIELPPDCTTSFEQQLAALSAGACPAMRVNGPGCFVQDVYPAAAKHTSMIIHPLGSNRFDLRFYE